MTQDNITEKDLDKVCSYLKKAYPEKKQEHFKKIVSLYRARIKEDESIPLSKVPEMSKLIKDITNENVSGLEDTIIKLEEESLKLYVGPAKEDKDRTMTEIYDMVES